ncbi:MAG: DNA-deoxyinosine glycosylase [Clostridiales bacterium]|nr:DNA-deoxyinosine glycosylase [Clostridiales bacterium]
MQNARHATHDSVPPLIDEHCHTLVLGSMLSPKSVEASFYYAHPQNRFWRVLAAVFNENYSTDTAERSKLALDHGIALWDVIYSCDIIGAADSTITNVEFNDIVDLLACYPSIKRIYTTGGAAFKLLKKYAKTVDNSIVRNAQALPSTSPLNCATSLDALISKYSVLANIPQD